MDETSADQRVRSIINAADPTLQTAYPNTSGILAAALGLSRRITTSTMATKACQANKIGSLVDLGCPGLGGLVRSHRIANRHSAFRISPTDTGGTFKNLREGIR